MKYPRLEPLKDIRCSESCGAIAFDCVKGGQPIVIECGKRGCMKFVRGDSVTEVEAAWAVKCAQFAQEA